MNNLMHGLGKEDMKDGSNYTGMYSNGEKNGKGLYIWGDKSTYDGEWKNDCIDGKGV